jgi:hypothetical protein
VVAWHCPLLSHDDRHPSVSMFTDRAGHQRWRCWSGEDTHRGDAIDLVIAVRRCSRLDAVEWLANRFGIAPADAPSQRARRPPPATVEPAGLPDPDPSVVRYVGACERILWTVGGRPVRRWLAERGLVDEELLRANHVGADPGRQLLPRRRGLPPGASTAAVLPALDETGGLRWAQQAGNAAGGTRPSRGLSGMSVLSPAARGPVQPQRSHRVPPPRHRGHRRQAVLHPHARTRPGRL